MAGFVDTPRRLAIPLVCALIAILAYGSQLLFARAGASRLPPGALTRREFLIFNGSLLCLWWTYYRVCTANAGRYRPCESAAAAAAPASTPFRLGRARWCSRCRAPKPARAHHCRRCGRCIPRMDHHCPWIGNCVSLTTFPHFVRFLAWATAALLQLCGHLWARGAALWAARDLPAYLGPTAGELAGFGLLAVCCAQVTVMMVVTLAAVVLGSARNQTMIEDFELSRHHALLARGADWWWSRGDETEAEAEGGDGASAVEPTEFPYDIGVFRNLAQAMGTKNPLWWLFPLAGAPELDPDGTGTGIGWTYPENGLNRRVGMWPPYDPDKAGRRVVGWPAGPGRIGESGWGRGKGGEEKNRLGGTMRDLGVDEGESGPEHESGSSSSQRYSDFAENDEKSDHDDDDDVLIGELIRRRAHPAEAGSA